MWQSATLNISHGVTAVTNLLAVHARSVTSDSATLWTVTRRLLCPRDSPGKNTGVGCHFLLQGTFPAQGSDPHLLRLLHCRQILYPLSHWGGPTHLP